MHFNDFLSFFISLSRFIPELFIHDPFKADRILWEWRAVQSYGDAYGLKIQGVGFNKKFCLML